MGIRIAVLLIREPVESPPRVMAMPATTRTVPSKTVRATVSPMKRTARRVEKMGLEPMMVALTGTPSLSMDM